MTPTNGAWSSGNRYFRCQEAAISLSLRHQRLSFRFLSIRFSHREDRGLDDRNYTGAASEKDVFKQIRACVHDLLRKYARLIEHLNRSANWTGWYIFEEYSILWLPRWTTKYMCISTCILAGSSSTRNKKKIKDNKVVRKVLVSLFLE